MCNEIDRSVHWVGQVGVISTEWKSWLQEVGLSSTWDSLHPNEQDYTYFSARHKTYARLGYILGSPQVMDQQAKAKIGVQVISNYTLFWVTMNIPKVPAHHNAWRLRGNLLYSKQDRTSNRDAILLYYLKKKTLRG